MTLTPKQAGYPQRLQFEGLRGAREYTIEGFRVPRKGEYVLSRDGRQAYRVPSNGVTMACRVVKPKK